MGSNLDRKWLSKHVTWPCLPRMWQVIIWNHVPLLVLKTIGTIPRHHCNTLFGCQHDMNTTASAKCQGTKAQFAEISRSAVPCSQEWSRPTPTCQKTLVGKRTCLCTVILWGTGSLKGCVWTVFGCALSISNLSSSNLSCHNNIYNNII